MEDSEIAYLSTVGNDGFPYTRAIFNLRNIEQYPTLAKLFVDHKDDLLVYFTTNTSSLKVEQIKKNPVVSIYYCVPREFRGAMIGGLMEIVIDKNLKKELWIDGWERYYPEGVKDSDYTVLRLSPKFVRGWAENKKFALNLS